MRVVLVSFLYCPQLFHISGCCGHDKKADSRSNPLLPTAPAARVGNGVLYTFLHLYLFLLFLSISLCYIFCHLSCFLLIYSIYIYILLYLSRCWRPLLILYDRKKGKKKYIEQGFSLVLLITDHARPTRRIGRAGRVSSSSVLLSFDVSLVILFWFILLFLTGYSMEKTVLERVVVARLST